MDSTIMKSTSFREKVSSAGATQARLFHAAQWPGSKNRSAAPTLPLLISVNTVKGRFPA
jgi:hypothetical protein